MQNARRHPEDDTRPALRLVEKPAARPSLLVLWHLLSLDAPTVAALWTGFIARSVGIALPWAGIAAMFVAVWLLYAADRLLDSRTLAANSNASGLEERHRFHHRHRRTFLFVCVPAALLLAGLLHKCDPRALHLYALLATLLGTWLLLVHARADAHRLPKELAVGIFFPAAVFIPTVARMPSLRMELLPVALIFGAVCTLNCLFVYAWEHPTPTQRHEQAHASTLWAVQHLITLTIIVIACAALLALPLAPVRSPLITCIVSAFLLLALHQRRQHMNRVTLRALADMVLLTPLLAVCIHA